MRKLFTEKQIGVSAIIGGPIPPGILFYLNYKRINKDKEAYLSLAITFLFTVALFYTIIKLPTEIVDKIPNAAITGFYGMLVYFLYRRFLSKEINQLLSEGNTKANNWTVVGMIVLGICINLIIILGLAINQPAFEGQKLNFGNTEHEIYFDDSKTSIDDVNKLGLVLTEEGYFTDEFPVAVHLDTWETRYIVTLQIAKEHWDNPEVIQYLTVVRDGLIASYKRDVTLLLEDYDLAGKKYEKRL